MIMSLKPVTKAIAMIIVGVVAMIILLLLVSATIVTVVLSIGISGWYPNQ